MGATHRLQRCRKAGCRKQGAERGDQGAGPGTPHTLHDQNVGIQFRSNRQEKLFLRSGFLDDLVVLDNGHSDTESQ